MISEIAANESTPSTSKARRTERSGGDTKEENNKKGITVSLKFITFASSIGGFLYGYGTTVISGAMLVISAEFHLSSIWHGLIVSATEFSAWAGSLVAGSWADKCGRKFVIILSSIVYFIGAVTSALADDKLGIFVGRILTGTGIGFSSMCVPLYISEQSPAKIRGKLSVVNVIAINAGQFVAMIVCGAFVEVPDGRRWMLGLAAVPAFVQFVLFLFAPESAEWLSKHEPCSWKGFCLWGHPAEQRQALLEMENHSEIGKRNNKKPGQPPSQIAEEAVGEVKFLSALSAVNVRRALVVGCALQFFQQFSGINAIMYYSPSIIQMAGVWKKTTAIWLASIPVFFYFAASCVTYFLVERAGRRPLVLYSTAGTTFGVLILAATFHAIYVTSPEVLSTESATDGTDCFMHATCSLCVEDSDCGYCFKPNARDGDMPYSFCLPANHSAFDEVSEDSFYCNTLEHADGAIFAYSWCPSNLSPLLAAALCTFVIFFAIGMCSMPWTINSEIYPLRARAGCIGIATSVNWIGDTIVSLTFLPMTEALKKHGVFYFYLCLNALGWITLYYILPETRGVPLEEVEHLFDRPPLSARFRKPEEEAIKLTSQGPSGKNEQPTPSRNYSS